MAFITTNAIFEVPVVMATITQLPNPVIGNEAPQSCAFQVL